MNDDAEAAGSAVVPAGAGAVDYAIRDGVPLPPPKALHRGKYAPQYPFDRLEVGQCFEYELSVVEAGRLRSRAGAYGKRSGKRFAVRSSNGKGACWRVE